LRVLITGKNSFIGNSFESYAKATFQIDKCSLRGQAWKEESWAGYDAVLHVAGIAHSDVSHATEKEQELYYAINRDLTKQAAEKAKADRVKQFIYMSSAIVYGESAPIGEEKKITMDTLPSPDNFYGDSKLQGEQVILPLQSEDFQIMIIRTPMVYGKEAKGNFPKLMKLSKITPIFPKIDNRKSMIYIENLCEFIRIGIEKRLCGTFLPQNREIVSTGELVRLLAEASEKPLLLVPGLQGLFKLLSHLTGYINKIFGSLEYDQGASHQELEYCRYSLKDSIEKILE